MKKQKNVMSKFFEILQSQDIFGVPVSLTYKKDPFIKSIYGGMLTMIARLAVLGILIYELTLVFNRKANIISSFYRRDLAVDETEYNLTLEDFDFGVRLEYIFFETNPEIQKNLDQYVHMQVSQTTEYWGKDEFGDEEEYYIEHRSNLGPCSNTRLGLTPDAQDYLSIQDDYQCPLSDFYYVLKGSQASKETKYLQISLNDCNQTYLTEKYGSSVKCKSASEAAKVIPYLKLYFVILNSYFEEDNFSSNPTPTFLRPYFFTTKNNTSQVYYILMSENEVSMNDGMLFGSEKTTTYVDTRLDYQIQQEILSVNSTKNPYLSVSVMMDDQVKTVQREVLTLIGAAQNTGGFMSILFTAAMLLSQKVQKTVYFTSLIKSLFQYQLEQYEVEEKGKKERKSQDPYSQKALAKIRVDQEQSQDVNQTQLGSLQTQTKYPLEGIPQQSIYSKILSQILNRQKLQYSIGRALCDPFAKFFCRFKKSKHETYQRSLYQTGIEKVYEELDIRNIVKQLRQMKFISNIFLTKYQRMMLPYFKDHLLNHKFKLKTKNENQDKLQSFLRNIVNNSFRDKLDKRILKAVELTDEQNPSIFHKTPDSPINIQQHSARYHKSQVTISQDQSEYQNLAGLNQLRVGNLESDYTISQSMNHLPKNNNTYETKQIMTAELAGEEDDLMHSIIKDFDKNNKGRNSQSDQEQPTGNQSKRNEHKPKDKSGDFL